MPATSDTEAPAVPLPAIDELTPASSVAAFLQAGVPSALRNAALRRMWTLDPAIRDFAGHARDYDYDWNTPGGVPGSGAIEADEVPAMLRRIFAEPKPGADSPATDELRDEAATADSGSVDASPPQPATAPCGGKA